MCDTEVFPPDLPIICTGLRRMNYREISVQGADHHLHSGICGGVAPNPSMALADILIPGFYDRVRKTSRKKLDAWPRLPFNQEEYRSKEIGVKARTGEPGQSLFECVPNRQPKSTRSFAP